MSEPKNTDTEQIKRVLESMQAPASAAAVEELTRMRAADMRKRLLELNASASTSRPPRARR